MENRLQIIKDLEKLLNTTRAAEGIQIRYGYAERKYSEPDENGKRQLIDIKFYECDKELGIDSIHCEIVQLRWGEQSDLYATYQSIEGDSGVSIINDIMKAVNRMI